MSAIPSWIEPMKATLSDTQFSNKNWLYEPKLDGIRCITYAERGQIKLLSRNQLDMNETYPEIVDALKRQKQKSFILDGEIVAFRPRSTVTSFGVLQQRSGIHNAAEARRSRVPVFYYLFDLLFLNGRDLRTLPLEERKATLSKTIRFNDKLRYSTHVLEKGETYFHQACRLGWEGLIAKRRDSRYQSGRSRDWIKFKCLLEQEFVIGGYTDPEGARTHFGALLMGYYDKGVLRYAGKVGTGFTQATLEKMMQQLSKLEQGKMPFMSVDIPKYGLHWVKPKLVAQIGFAEWTDDGKLRQGRFIGLRNDKKPTEVTRELPKHIAGGNNG